MSLMAPQDPDIEVDENGTLDLSMKKPIKSEGMQSPVPSSSSSSSSQNLGGRTSTQSHTQAEWEGPLDFTKPSGQKEEEQDEVTICQLQQKNTKRISSLSCTKLHN